MKQTLSVKHLVLLLLVACGSLGTKGQTTLTTVYPNNPNYLLITPGSTPTPMFVTFTVKNNNCYPVTVTDFSIFHSVTQNNISNNGAVYTVLRQPGSPASVTTHPITGAPLITSWPVVGTSNPITTGGNGVVPVVTGTNSIIAPGEEARFAFVSNDSMLVRNTVGTSAATQIIPSPKTFSNNGITLTTVDPDGVQQRIHYGTYPTVSHFHTPLFSTSGQVWVQYGMEGGITARRAGPTVAIVNNNACDTSGDSITLVATVPPCVTNLNSINWTGPAFPGTHTGATWKILASLANSGKYYATYSAGTPADISAATEVTVSVTPRPIAPKITTKTAYCIGEPFQPVVADGQNILWYTIPSGGTGTTVPPYVNTNTAGSYTWYASQTVGNCEGPRTGVTITVAPIPVRPTVVTPVVYCENEPAAPLTAGGTGLIWYVDPVGGLGSVIAPVPGTSVKDTLSWYVSQKIDGCEGPRSRIDVLVTFKPNGMILVSDTPWICQHEELTFSYYGSATEFTGITWKVPSPAATSVSGGIGLDPITIRFDSAGLQQVIMSANNLGCLGDPFVQYVTVKPIPFAFINAPEDVCPNADKLVVLDEFTPTIDTFKWDFDGGITAHFATDQGPYGVYWKEPGQKVIKLTIVDELCVGEATDTVTVRELPDAKIKVFFDRDQDNNFDGFDVKNATLCSGDSLRLEPNTIVANSRYEWTPTRFFDNASNLPVTFARVDFSGMINLKVTDDLGCIGTDSIMVKTRPCCDIAFPNAFTPNGDGRNDRFKAITEGYHGTRTFQIFNRFGQIVYESVDEHRGWDGMMKGEPADMGTYFYHINFKCDNKWTDQKGEFMLVR